MGAPAEVPRPEGGAEGAEGVGQPGDGGGRVAEHLPAAAHRDLFPVDE
jgi:hypothetical protein